MKYAVVCPGQGSQAIGMGQALYREFSYAQEMFEEASDVLKHDMKALLFEENDIIRQSAWTQPAILLVSVVAFKIFLKESAIEPSFVLGHSLGELSAVCISGALSLAEALSLVHKRGKLMQACSKDIDVGMMVVMGLDDSTVEQFVAQQKKDIWIANYNSDVQIVLAGKKNDLQEIVPKLKEMKAKRALLLDMSVVSHCPLLNDIVVQFEELLQESLHDCFVYPIVSNVTTEQYKDKQRAIALLSQQLVAPVKYKQCIKAHEGEVDFFVECGHGTVLKGLNARLTSKPTLNISDTETLQETLHKFKGI